MQNDTPACNIDAKSPMCFNPLISLQSKNVFSSLTLHITDQNQAAALCWTTFLEQK